MGKREMFWPQFCVLQSREIISHHFQSSCDLAKRSGLMVLSKLPHMGKHVLGGVILLIGG